MCAKVGHLKLLLSLLKGLHGASFEVQVTNDGHVHSCTLWPPQQLGRLGSSAGQAAGLPLVPLRWALVRYLPATAAALLHLSAMTSYDNMPAQTLVSTGK